MNNKNTNNFVDWIKSIFTFNMPSCKRTTSGGCIDPHNAKRSCILTPSILSLPKAPLPPDTKLKGSKMEKVATKRCNPLHICHKKFKSEECGYIGSGIWCDHTFAWCRHLGNVKNFGGDRCDFLKNKNKKEVTPE